jgi:hypothetical protein
MFSTTAGPTAGFATAYVLNGAARPGCTGGSFDLPIAGRPGTFVFMALLGGLRVNAGCWLAVVVFAAQAARAVGEEMVVLVSKINPVDFSFAPGADRAKRYRGANVEVRLR